MHFNKNEKATNKLDSNRISLYNGFVISVIEDRKKKIHTCLLIKLFLKIIY